jgi:hypothetical protein
MKTKSLKIISAIAIAFCCLGTTVFAQGNDSRIGSIGRERVDHGATEAKAITQAEAQKKYPMSGNSYPVATRNPHDPSGVVVSPYPPHEKYDCSKVGHGGLAVDPKVNKVFVRP